jgi:cytidylate kinase
VIANLARASTMLASAPLEGLDVAEGRVRSQLAEFLARASSSGGVVLGHGGCVAVPDEGSVLHVLPTAPLDARISRVAAREQLGRAEAQRRVRARDRARRDYVRRAYGIDSDERRLYHLIVDTVALGTDGAVDLVLAATRVRIQKPAGKESENA